MLALWHKFGKMPQQLLLHRKHLHQTNALAITPEITIPSCSQAKVVFRHFDALSRWSSMSYIKEQIRVNPMAVGLA